MAKIHIAGQGIQDVKLDVSHAIQAREQGMSLAAYLNSTYAGDPQYGSAFDQAVASLGIEPFSDPAKGIRASTLHDVWMGKGAISAGLNTADTSAEGALLLPAVVLTMIEDQLQRDLSTAASAFDRMVANTQSIAGQHFTRVITNFAEPSKARSQGIAQGARPANMLLLTGSERQGVIPVEALGIEWTDQVAKLYTIDVVAQSVARQVAVERDAQAQEATIAILNGNPDIGQGALPAAYRHTVTDLDPSAPVNGGVATLTQTAWLRFLYQNGNFRTINWVITDFDTALKIQSREGRPTIEGDDNKSPRIDTKMRLAYPVLPDEVEVFVTRHPDWPAGTILGLDRRYGIQRVNSLDADYAGFERDPMRRTHAMRWDQGSMSYRLYDEAFSLLELT